MPGSNKRSYKLKLKFLAAGLFKYVCSYVTTKHKRVKNH